MARTPQIGIGGGHPLALCHTTGYAGPHRAVRRVKLTVSRELGKPERGEENVRQSIGRALAVNFH